MHRFMACLAGACLFALSARVARACIILGPPILRGESILGALDTSYPPIPRNAVFLWTSWDGQAPPSDGFPVVVDATSQAPFAGRIVRLLYGSPPRSNGYSPATFVATTDALLPQGGAVSTSNERTPVYTIGDFIDEKPPSAPRIVNGVLQSLPDDSTCGPLTAIRVELEQAHDDRMPAALLGYAFYLGRSAAETSGATNPFIVLGLEANGDTGQLDSLRTFVPREWSEGDAYVAVSAIDWAGNESERSAVFKVAGGEEGCACRMAPQSASTWWRALPLLGALAWLRRRRR